MDCPVCQKVNTDTALTCDCGHKFAESTTTLDATRIEPAHRTTFFKLIMGLLGLGAVGMGWLGVQTGEPEFLVKASVLALGVVASWYGNWIGPLCIIGLYLYHGIVLAQEGKLGLAEIVGILIGILLVVVATWKVWKPSYTVTTTVGDGPMRATPKNTSDWTWVLWVGALIGVVAGLGWCASSTTTPSRPAAAQVSTATEAPRPAYTPPPWSPYKFDRVVFDLPRGYKLQDVQPEPIKDSGFMTHYLRMDREQDFFMVEKVTFFNSKRDPSEETVRDLKAWRDHRPCQAKTWSTGFPFKKAGGQQSYIKIMYFLLHCGDMDPADTTRFLGSLRFE